MFKIILNSITSLRLAWARRDRIFEKITNANKQTRAGSGVMASSTFEVLESGVPG